MTVLNPVFNMATASSPQLFLPRTVLTALWSLLPLQDTGDLHPNCCRSCSLTEAWEDGAWKTGLEDSLRGGWGPALPWGNSCLKGLTFLSNFLFSLLSLLALAAGLWGLALKGSLGNDLGGPVPPDPMLGLVLGGLVLSAVSLAGCLGALCESTWLLRCFLGALLSLLVLEALLGALVVLLWGPLQDGLEGTLLQAITRYPNNQDLRFLIDQVQLGLQCCGLASYQDWQQNPHFNCSFLGPQACSLPASCCITLGEAGASVDPQCGSRALGLTTAAARQMVHVEGCGAPLRQWLRWAVPAVGSCAIAVVLMQVLELLLAALLLRALAGCKGGAGKSPDVARDTGSVPSKEGACGLPSNLTLADQAGRTKNREPVKAATCLGH
ncbi:tetraspanin-10 [Erinaceus europaeus]|uniref:Tetraspanin-10 n=1 Tax=Erinaceus europaeus TaxID=9365 RepID=A0A1S3AGV2_ERIEU|nr:tetraspanin-10 [Erinaceus europaeus]